MKFMNALYAPGVLMVVADIIFITSELFNDIPSKDFATRSSKISG